MECDYILYKAKQFLLQKVENEHPQNLKENKTKPIVLDIYTDGERRERSEYISGIK